MESNAVLREIEEFSKKSFLPIIGPAKGKYLVDTVRRFDVKRVLEVGTLIGYSAILMAQNLPENGKIITIEKNPQSSAMARENMRKAGLDDKIEVHIGNAIAVIPGIDGTFDMVFLDATKSEYLDYIQLAESKLKKDGAVFADNVKMFASEMRDYLGYVRDSNKYRSEYIDVGFDGMEISTKLF